jgi:hypothetical protein
MALVWDTLECPNCGATVPLGVMSLTAACEIDGFYYVDVDQYRGWYSSRAAYERGDAPV